MMEADETDGDFRLKGDMDMKLQFGEYMNKLSGCYTGKAVGGTLGMPYEGFIGTVDLTYYDPVPTHMIENDDIDLQVVWLQVLRECGLPVNRLDLANGWLCHMRGLPDEYGVVIRNLKHGLRPPLSGSYDNKFGSGMGSAIRTEIWAGLAPGDPDLAVKLSLEDAVCDHHGDGVDATAFLAALESYAFVESDHRKLLDKALGYLPKEGRVYTMIRKSIEMFDAGVSVRDIRLHLLKTYYSQNWTDVATNLSFITLGLLEGQKQQKPADRISVGLCTAVGLGHDADCTGATLGAIFGILYPNDFEERWTAPLGDDLVLSSCIASMHETNTITDFCAQIADAAIQLLPYYGSTTELTDAPAVKKALYIQAEDPNKVALQYRSGVSDYDLNESLIALNPYLLRLMYPSKTALAPNESGEFTLKYDSDGINAGRLCITASDGYSVSPCEFDLAGSGELRFTVTAPESPRRRSATAQLNFRFKADGVRFDVQAGLISSYPIARKAMVWESDECPDASVFADAVVEQWENHFAPCPAGGQLYRFEVRLPYAVAEAIMVCQASRPVKVWRDGKLILSHDGTESFPPFHRTENIVMMPMGGSWSEVVVYVADKLAKEHYSPYAAIAKVPGCPTPYEQRQMYDDSLGVYEDGELYIGFANRSGYEWLWEIEYK